MNINLSKRVLQKKNTTNNTQKHHSYTVLIFLKEQKAEFLIGILYFLYLLLMVDTIKDYVYSVYYLSMKFYHWNHFVITIKLLSPIFT